MDPEQQQKQIGEILVEKGLITREQLREALAHQQDHPDEKIGEVLVKLGFVSMKEVIQAYAEQVLMRYGGDDDEDLQELIQVPPEPNAEPTQVF